MMKNILPLFLLSVLSGYAVFCQDVPNTIINGEIENKKNEFFYIDELDQKITLTGKHKAGGSFKLSLKGKTFLYLIEKQTNKWHGLYLIKPGDTLQIVENKGTVIVCSADEIRNYELSFFQTYMKSNKTFTPDIPLLKPEQQKYRLFQQLRDKIADSCFKSNMNFLNEYWRKKKVTEEFRADISAAFFFLKIDMQLRFMEKYPSGEQDYFNDLRKYAGYFSQPEHLFLANYTNTLRLCNALLARTNSLTEKDYYKKRFITTQQYFNGGDKDYLLLDITKSLLKQSAPDKRQSILDTFYLNCKSSLYVNYVKEKFDLSEIGFGLPDSTRKQIIFFTGKGKEIMLDSILNTKDFIFIDFWASWCGPCVENIKKIGTSNVEKIWPALKVYYVSLDADVIKWKKISAQLNIPPQQNLLLPHSFEAPLAKMLKLTDLPRYVLFYKGKLISANTESLTRNGTQKLIADILRTENALPELNKKK